jgi:hypothetical protein
MNKRKTGFILILLCSMALGLLYPQNQEKIRKTKDLQIEGEVVDLTCYTSRGLSGAGHKSCATRCLTRGAPAGLVDQDGNIFVIIAPSPGYASYAAQTIRLSGSVEDGRINPNKMEAMTEKNWAEVTLQGGSPKPE